MKRKLFFSLLVGVLMMAMLPSSITPVMGDSNSPNYSYSDDPDNEELEKAIERARAGIDKPLLAPRDKWPEIPAPPSGGLMNLGDSEPKYPQSRQDMDYYQAGIQTEDNVFCGLQVEIFGGFIDNDDPEDEFVRLTPHLAADNDDYIAIVLDKRDEQYELELWTFDVNADPEDQYEYHTSIVTYAYYEFSIYVAENNQYYIHYKPYGQNWVLIRTGYMQSRATFAVKFLEHAIPEDGECTEHSSSWWRNMELRTLDNYWIWWDDEVDTDPYVLTIPPNLDNPLQEEHDISGDSWLMETWSSYD